MSLERVKVSGPVSQMTMLRNNLLANPLDGVEIEPIAEAPNDPLDPRPLGMEPEVYFFVCFAAHLSASLVHDYIARWRTGGPPPQDAHGERK